LCTGGTAASIAILLLIITGLSNGLSTGLITGLSTGLITGLVAHSGPTIPAGKQADIPRRKTTHFSFFRFHVRTISSRFIRPTRILTTLLDSHTSKARLKRSGGPAVASAQVRLTVVGHPTDCITARAGLPGSAARGANTFIDLNTAEPFLEIGHRATITTGNNGFAGIGHATLIMTTGHLVPGVSPPFTKLFGVGHIYKLALTTVIAHLAILTVQTALAYDHLDLT